MKNPYQTTEAKILKITDQAPEVKSFEFKLTGNKTLDYQPGQFFVFSLPGYGESVFVPMEIVGRKNLYEIAIHKVGRVTSAFHNLKVGDTFGIRGPYGNGWGLDRIKDKNLLLIAGGIGLVPIRSLINYLLNRNLLDFKKQQVQLLYGCRNFGLVLFKKELQEWNKKFNILVSLDDGDHPKNAPLECYRGVLGVLFQKGDIVQNGCALLCGPPVVYKFIVPEVVKIGYPDENILLSLERRMHCAGLGTCQHCAIGPYYVCKDGPVFTYKQLKETVQYN